MLGASVQRIGYFIQHLSNGYGFTGEDRSTVTLVDVMWSLWHVWEVGRIVPSADELAARVGPVKAIGDDLDVSSYLAYVLGELECIVIGQSQAHAQVSIVQGSPFTSDFKPANERIGQQACLDSLVVFCDRGHKCVSSSLMRSRRRSAI